MLKPLAVNWSKFRTLLVVPDRMHRRLACGCQRGKPPGPDTRCGVLLDHLAQKAKWARVAAMSMDPGERTLALKHHHRYLCLVAKHMDG